jgi:hypothetical protein
MRWAWALALLAIYFAASAGAEDAEALRVRALGCFFEVPSSYTLIADPGDRILFIALGHGSISIEPWPDRISPTLSRVSSRTEGYLEIAEFSDHDPKEPLQLTAIHNAMQAVTLLGDARALETQIVQACLAHIHPRAPGAP